MSLVFINQIDSYFGSTLADIFCSTPIGSLHGDIVKLPDAEHISNLCYNVSGTICNPDHPNNVPGCLMTPVDFDILRPKILDQDIIIYNIVDDPKQVAEAEFAINALHHDLEKFVNPKTFILISTCLTWAKTRPVDPDEPDSVFTEEDYRMRRTHPSFKEHIALEKLVTKFGRTKRTSLSTMVLSCGLIYGYGENILQFLFKHAWLGDSYGNQLPVFGNGQNYVPTIHVLDLASILINLVEVPPIPRYLIAVDESKNTLEEIVKAISSELGTGNIRNFSREDSLLIPDVGQLLFDTLMINLRMDARYIKDNMNLHWKCENGIVTNISVIAREFKRKRLLLPLKLCILGPPASGKTTLANKLAQFYKIHHISISDVIRQQLVLLENLVARTSGNDVGEDYETRAEQAKDLLQTLVENSENNSGRYDDRFIIDFVKSKLRSKPCQNQGYVLDGYPKTIKQAHDLFGVQRVSQANDLDEDQSSDYNTNFSPEYIIQLDSTEAFLRQRLTLLPQNIIEGTHNNEEGFFRRFTEYQNLNSMESTVLSFFDENEIEIIKLDISYSEHCKLDLNTSANVDSFLKYIIDRVGKPQNYGPTKEELEIIYVKDANAKLLRRTESRNTRLALEMDQASRNCANHALWTAQITEIQHQHYEYHKCQSMPLRNYLLKFVMPTVSRGLVDLSEAAPDDPIDYLAEYLFKNSPCMD